MSFLLISYVTLVVVGPMTAAAGYAQVNQGRMAQQLALLRREIPSAMLEKEGLREELDQLASEVHDENVDGLQSISEGLEHLADKVKKIKAKWSGVAPNNAVDEQRIERTARWAEMIERNHHQHADGQSHKIKMPGLAETRWADKFGLQAYISAKQERALLQNMTEMNTLQVDQSTEIKLVQLAADNTISRLRGEMRDDKYGLRTVDQPPALIVDAGANIGDFCIHAAKVYKQAQVLCFEPAPETYFLMRWNLNLNNVSILSEGDMGKHGRHGVIPIHGAIAPEEGTVSLHYNPQCSQNAATGPGGDGIKEAAGWEQAVTVRGVDLHALLRNHGVNTIDFLKMDCEGCEFAVVPALRDLIGDRERVRRFSSEIHWSLDGRRTKESTFAAKFSGESIDATQAVLSSREGCRDAVKRRDWAISC